jgi:hypothetical protein
LTRPKSARKEDKNGAAGFPSAPAGGEGALAEVMGNRKGLWRKPQGTIFDEEMIVRELEGQKDKSRKSSLRTFGGENCE